MRLAVRRARRCGTGWPASRLRCRTAASNAALPRHPARVVCPANTAPCFALAAHSNHKRLRAALELARAHRVTLGGHLPSPGSASSRTGQSMADRLFGQCTPLRPNPSCPAYSAALHALHHLTGGQKRGGRVPQCTYIGRLGPGRASKPSTPGHHALRHWRPEWPRARQNTARRWPPPWSGQCQAKSPSISCVVRERRRHAASTTCCAQQCRLRARL